MLRCPVDADWQWVSLLIYVIDEDVEWIWGALINSLIPTQAQERLV